MTMVTSPTGIGVIVIGGFNHSENKHSDVLLELTEDSKGKLKWFVMHQKLQYAREGHLTFPIPNAIYYDLIKGLHLEWLL